jgi:CotS family spore coat protein
MEISKINYNDLEIVLSNYSIIPTNIIEIRSAYKIETSKKILFLKRFKHNTKKVEKVESIIKFLNSKSFYNTPGFIYTSENKLYVEYKDYFYYMTEWLAGDECDFKNKDELQKAIELLANFHKASLGFVDPSVEIEYKYIDLIQEFSQKMNDFEKFIQKIAHRKIRTFFDKFYIENMNYFYFRGDLAINILKNSNYSKMLNNPEDKYLCHDSFYYQNLIKLNGDMYIVDLDQCSHNIKAYDLGKFIRRMMTKKEYEWDFQKSKEIISIYDSFNSLNEDDYKILLAIAIFPHKFWKLGSKRYFKNKAWLEDKYLKRLEILINEGNLIDKYVKDYKNFYKIDEVLE